MRSRKVVLEPGVETSGRDAVCVAAAPDAGPATPLEGCLEQVSLGWVRGWARDTAELARPVQLCVLADDVFLAKIVADRHRADLATAGYGIGHHGFEFAWPAGSLAPDRPHAIEVRQAGTGARLAGSPCVLAPALPAPPPNRPAPGCRGFLDVATREHVCGWARDDGDPDAPVELVICDNGTPVARIFANCFRSDLATALPGTGRHAFTFSFPAGLSSQTRHIISVRRARDGSHLANSPAVIEAGGSFGEDARAAIADAVTAAVSADDLAHVLSFLTAQADQLRQRQADADTGRNERLARRLMQRRRGPPAAPAGTPAADGPATPHPRILVISEKMPAAGRTGAWPAIVAHMEGMLSLPCAVSFVAAGRLDATAGEIAPLLDRGIACCRAPVYSSVEDVLRRQGDGIDLVYLHGTDIATRYLSLVRAHSPRARVIYCLPKPHHIRAGRGGAGKPGPDLIAARRRLRLAECTAAWSADAVVMHSSAAARLLRRAVPQARIHIVAADAGPPVQARQADCHGLAFIGELVRAKRLPDATAGTATPPEAVPA